MRLRYNLLFALIFLSFFLNSCKKDAPFVPLFSISDDIKLGKQVVNEIEVTNRVQFPVLDSASNIAAYRFLYGIRDEILNSGKVVYKDEFEWRLRIIRNDTTLNAFCTPGGYIYVYTGLIKFLNSKDQLAGVLAHEMAHADRRHTSRSMQTQYGVTTLLNILLGNDNSTLQQIASGIYLLKNSRDHESEADEYSVKYLCPTSYNAAGAAGFFQKMIDEGYTENRLASFFSTHPSPVNRVENILQQKIDNGCIGNGFFDAEYNAFKNLIP
jgi:Zn-dependent protease with chaperone function